MSTDSTDPNDPNNPIPPVEFEGTVIDTPIQEQLSKSYMDYAMSVIVSRALPDVRDGLKPSQRRILVAMNDLNLRPGSSRVKCAKISGDTSGNYHPHGESVIYPTLVRMAQEWNMRHVLVDKQGNFGSIAGLPAAAMRYTEARLSPVAALLLDDLDRDTVDFIPTYDERRTEPTVLPSKFPNLLVNGAGGIAVGMATSIPPHNLGEVCTALIHMIDHPDATIYDVLEHIQGPDFPTGGILCGRSGMRQAYLSGRGSVVVRAKAVIEENGKKSQIVVSEIPYQQTRDRIMERIDSLIRDGRIKGLGECRDESNIENPVRLVLEIKSNADAEVVLNQLYQYSQLQDTFSIILLALVDGRPRSLNLLELLGEFLRHRLDVIRRRTQFLLAKARRRKHLVEGLLLAYANIDEIIKIIRTSSTQEEAKVRLMGVECPSSLMQRALGEKGFTLFQEERGVTDVYTLTAIQADAILHMTLGRLVNLEQEKLANEFEALLAEISEYVRILSDDRNIFAIIREDLEEIIGKHANDRRTEIDEQELGDFDLGELIPEETMVVTISHRDYIKRTPATVYRQQRRGGKGVKGSQSDDDDPVKDLFVASSHAYMLFFSTKGKVYWKKIYDLPALARERRGRALVNLLQLSEGERIAACLAVRDFEEQGRFLMMSTKDGLVKKTRLDAYSRPMKGGIIAIKLKENDELKDVIITTEGDEVVISTTKGMAIRFNESDARPMGRNTSGVKGIRLSKGDALVSMVVANPDSTLLTVCENGYGKRTPFGPNSIAEDEGIDEDVETDVSAESDADNAEDDSASEDVVRSNYRYRSQKRGGKGVRDIQTTKRNGPVICAVSVEEDDDILIMTAGGKIQRISCSGINVIGRNTKGVRVMTLDKEDTIAAVVRVAKEDKAVEEELDADGAVSSAPTVSSETPSNEAPSNETTSDQASPATDEVDDADTDTGNSDEE